MTSKEPWLQQAGESAKAFAAFSRYRDLGPDRSLTQLGRLLDKSKQWVGEWSSKHGWVERVRAWDNHLERERLKNDAKERARYARTVAEQHRTIGSALLAKAAALLRDPKDGGIDPRTLKPSEMVRMLQIGAELTRESLAIEKPSATPESDLPVDGGHRTISIRVIGPKGETVGQEAIDAAAAQFLDKQTEE